ncbi:MAG: hypothetical protein ACRCSS_22980 [Shewanella sp.]
MQQPKEAIRSERAELAKENQLLVHDSNYQLHSNASYLDPGMRATLPALNEDMEQSIKLVKQQINGIKKMDALLQ